MGFGQVVKLSEGRWYHLVHSLFIENKFLTEAKAPS